MPAEIQIDINDGGGLRTLNDLTSSIDALALGAEGANSNLARVIGTLEKMASGRVAEVLEEIITKMKELGDTASISQLSQAIKEVAEDQETWGAVERQQLTDANNVVAGVKRQDQAVRDLIASYKVLEAQLSSGSLKSVNISKLTAEAGVFMDSRGLSAEQRGMVGGGIVGLQGANALRAAENEYEASQRKMVEIGMQMLREMIRNQELAAREEIKIYEDTQRQKSAIGRQELREQLRDQDQAARESAKIQSNIQALEDRASLAGLRGGARLGVERDIALRGVSDPADRARMTNAYEKMIAAASGGGPGGGGGAGGDGGQPALAGGFFRGMIQAGMGSGMLDFRAYYAMNAIQNLQAGARNRTLGSLFGQRGTAGGNAESAYDMTSGRMVPMETGYEFGASRWSSAAGRMVGGEPGAMVTQEAEAGAAGGMLGRLGGLSLGSVAAVSAGVLAFAAAEVTAANSASQHARELKNLAIEMGTTKTNARELENAARVSGVEIGTIVSGMRQLTQGIEESGGRGKGVSAILQSHGIDPQTATGAIKDTKEMMVEISGVVRGMGDLEGRDLLERLFGRGGRQLLPLMKQDLGSLLESMNKWNSGLDDARLEKYAETMSKLGLIWEGLVTQAARPIVFAVDLVTSNSWKEFMSKLENGILPKDKISSLLMGSIHALYPETTMAQGANYPQRPTAEQQDQMAGKAYREADIAWRATHTKEGLEGTVQSDRLLLQTAENTYNAGGARGMAPSEAEKANLDKLQEKLTADEAALKAFSAKDQNPTIQLELNKRLEAAQRKELFSYAKIDQETADSKRDLAERLGIKGKGVPPEMNRTIDETGEALKRKETADLAKLQEAADRRVSLASTQDQIRLGASKAAADTALERVMQHRDGSTIEDARDTFVDALKAVSTNYQLRQADIGNMREDLAHTADPRASIALQGQIAEKSAAADVERTNAAYKALIDFKIAGVRLDEQSKKLAVEIANEAERTRVAVAQSAMRDQIGQDKTISGIEESAMTRGLTSRLALMKARGTGGGAGRQGILAAAEESTRRQVAMLGWAGAQGTYAQDVGLANTEYAQNTTSLSDEHTAVRANMNTSDQEKEDARYKREQATLDQQHAHELSTLQNQYLQAYGKYQEELDLAHIDRMKTAAEIIHEQNTAVTEVGAGLIDAYMQAELHRQSGMFPMREALGKIYTQGAQTVGKNILSTGFGGLQKLGVGQSDILPGLARNVPDWSNTVADIDPTTGKQNVDAQGRPAMKAGEKEELTTLGKIFSGTMLGHRPHAVPIDKAVNDIKGHTQSIDETLKSMVKKADIAHPGGGPNPGESSDNPLFVAGAPNPTGGGGDIGDGLPMSATSGINHGFGMSGGDGTGGGAGGPGSAASTLGTLGKGVGGMIGGRAGGALSGFAGGLSGLASAYNKYKAGRSGGGGAMGPFQMMGPDFQAQYPGVDWSAMDNPPDATAGAWNGGSAVDLSSFGAMSMPGMPVGTSDANTGADMGTPTFSVTGTDYQPPALPYGQPSPGAAVNVPGALSATTSILAGASGTKFSTGSNAGAMAQDVVAAAGDAATIIQGVSSAKAVFDGQTGKSGAGAVLGGLSNVASTVAKVASTIPGGQLVAAGAEISAMVLGGVAAIFGNPRTDRAKAEQNFALQNTWTAPSAYNLVTTTSGQNATMDSTGMTRGTGGPLQAYPNTSAYTIGYDYTFNRNYGGPLPGGVQPVASTILSVAINAIDSKSVMDNSHLITNAVHAAINDGHPIQNAIANIANTK